MGYLPNTNLAITQINREYVVGSNSLITIGNSAQTYLPLGSDPYAMGTYRGERIPPAEINYFQNEGGIWDGCNYWDVVCWMEGYSPEGNYIDPDFGYVGPYWTQNGCSGFSYNSERGCGGGTELTFGGGEGQQYAHGRFTMKLVNVMIPQYTSFCTPVYLSIYVNGDRVACANPNEYDYTDVIYYLYCEPGETYKVTFRVDYGSC